jgi:drug/metabolite transporter (DMT)-like permease
MPRRPVLLMIGSAFFFSVMALLVRVAGRRIPSQEIVLLRGVMTLVFSWAILWRKGVSPWGVDRWRLFMRGVFGTVALSCFYHSICHLPMAEATVIQHTNPVFTALLAAWFLSERLQPAAVVSCLFSLAGVVLIARPAALFGHLTVPLDPYAVAIALGGALGSASAYVTIRQLSRTDHPDVIVFYFPLVTVPLTLPALATGAVWPTPWEWLVLAGVALTTQAAQVLMTRGLAEQRAASATALGYLQVVFAIAWGMLVFGERPDLLTLAGSLLIITGTLVVALSPPAELPPARPVH